MVFSDFVFVAALAPRCWLWAIYFDGEDVYKYGICDLVYIFLSRYLKFIFNVVMVGVAVCCKVGLKDFWNFQNESSGMKRYREN